MTKKATLLPACTFTTILWGAEGELHELRFTDLLGGEHVAMVQFDPVICHHSAPKNRLHRWLIQPGTVAEIQLPDSPAVNMKIKITEFADSQYLQGDYKNHKGVIELRSLVPLRVRWESTEYHTPQYILTGWCKDRQAERSFALSDFNFRAAKVWGDMMEPDDYDILDHQSIDGTTKTVPILRDQPDPTKRGFTPK